MKIYPAFFAVLAAGSLSLSFFLYLLKPLSSAVIYSEITIEKGAGFRAIAEQLQRAGLIRSPAAFKIYALASQAAAKLKAGTYWLSPSQTLPEIMTKLVVGPAADVEVVIFEGETVKDIDKKLSAAGIIRAGTLTQKTQSLEGFLFPDTYRFYPESSIDSVVSKFLENFQKKVLPAMEEKGKMNKEAIYEILKTASLIEKEIPLSGDRRLVSGIIHKRLKIDMPLQIDAAICYAKSRTMVGCHPLSRSDYDIESPYNTYKYKGLPPTPIANPGLDAVRAALNPKNSDYWYYLSDPVSKKTIFSVTLEEHNENRARYLGL
jgi:UPF0755 protein